MIVCVTLSPTPSSVSLFFAVIIFIAVQLLPFSSSSHLRLFFRLNLSQKFFFRNVKAHRRIEHTVEIGQSKVFAPFSCNSNLKGVAIVCITWKVYFVEHSGRIICISRQTYPKASELNRHIQWNRNSELEYTFRETWEHSQCIFGVMYVHTRIGSFIHFHTALHKWDTRKSTMHTYHQSLTQVYLLV